MKQRLLVLLAFVLFVNMNTRAQWDLVWSDEFDNDGAPDNAKWKFETGPNWYNGELQYYTNRTENARVENGNLVIEAIQEEYLGKHYTSARINSVKGWKYGRFEIKARLADGAALWPAIWMYPDADVYGGWPKSGEIDIMENWSWAHNEIFSTIHCESYYHVKHTEKQGSITVTDPAVNYHVYTLEWYGDQMRWFVDDVLFFSFYSEGTTSTYPFDHPFHFIFNVAIESTAPGKESTWKKRTMEIDWVRVYSGSTTGPAMPVNTVPAKIEAEQFINVQGIRSENCNQGGRNLCYVDAGDWVEYKVNAPVAGTYNAVFRVASSAAASFDVLSDNVKLTQVSVPNTTGWQTWKSVEVPLALKAGEQTIRIAFNGGVNLNWFEIKESTSTKISQKETSAINVFPNPAFDNLTVSGLVSYKKWNISLFNMAGKQVKELTTDDSQVDICVKDLKSGVYLASISDNNTKLNKVFVKK